MGVLLYILLSGCQPFQRKSSSLEVLNKALNVRPIPGIGRQGWGEVSKAGKDLVRNLLKVDPGKRLAFMVPGTQTLLSSLITCSHFC